MVPALTVAGLGDVQQIALPAFDTVDGERRRRRPRRPGVRGRGSAGLHGVRPGARQLRRRSPRPARRVAKRLHRSRRRLHPGLAGIDHRSVGGPGDPGGARVRDERDRLARTVDDHHGRRDLPVVPRRRHLPRGAQPAAVHRVDGPQRRRLGALRRTGEMPARHRMGDDGDGHRLVAPAAADGRHVVLVRAHRPVALRRLPRRRAREPVGPWAVPRQAHDGRAGLRRRDGLVAVLPAVRPLQPRPRRRGRRRPARRCRAYVAEELASGRLHLAVTDPDDPRNWPRVLSIWRANLLGSSSKGNEYFLRHLLGTDSNLQADADPGGPAAAIGRWREDGAEPAERPTGTAPRANSTC